jgi:immune inhibitor A
MSKHNDFTPEKPVLKNTRLHRVPPSPEVMAQIYADYLRIAQDRGITFEQYLISIGYTDKADNFHGMDDGANMAHGEHGLELISIPDKPITGQMRVKVLLVDFPDQPGSLSVSHYQQLLFSKDTHPTGSMRDYFREVTLGKVDVVGTVHGWLRMPNNYSFYTNNESGTEWNSYPRNAPRMAEDAVNAALAAGVEFPSDLDVLNDGTITALFIIHAGRGAEELNPSIRNNHIWSHKWVMRRAVNVGNNMFASTYLTVPNDCKVGVCAHELGHLAFQWEDFYDPNYDADGKEWDGSGSWDLMAGGSYNGGGHRPCHPAGLHKTQHNWVNVNEVTSSGQFGLQPYSATTGSLLKVISPKYRSGQYLLLENRKKTGFDSDLPGEGLLVWKVDESADMFAPEKPALLLVQADGRRQLQTPNDWNTGDAGDPFPGSSNRTDLTERGVISTSFPDGEDSGISLSNIQRDPDTGDISLQINFAGDSTSTSDVIRERVTPNMSIPDNNETGIESEIAISQNGMVRHLAVSVDITHTYVGDLRVELVAPNGQTVSLQNKVGGNADNLVKTWSSSTSPALTALAGNRSSGTWKLRVADLAGADVGRLNSWELAIELDNADPNIHSEVTPELVIPDEDPAGIASVIRIPRAGIARKIKVTVDIEHTYIGDLRIELVNPQGQWAMLHNKTGGSDDNLKTSFESGVLETLAPMIGQQINGDWTLRVADLVGSDVGKLKKWSLVIEMGAHASKVEKENTQLHAIPDDNPAGIGSSINFTEQGTVQTIDALVNISHTYIGDLRVELIAPSGRRALLHDQTGGRTRDLFLQESSTDSTELAKLVGEPLTGNWILRVSDLEGLDTGTLNNWSLKITYAE